MDNEIIIKQSGFVTGDALLNPIAYAGEMNSRLLHITHPLFDNCQYQLIVVKNNYPYVLGIQDGEILIPPSLINTSTKLDCQFIAIRNTKNMSINANLCDCQMQSSDDCTQFVFKSDKFSLIVEEGLNINCLTPIPPYEQLLDIYNNISNAKLAVEKIKAENEVLLETIQNKIDELQKSGYLLNLEKERNARIDKDNDLQKQIDSLN